MPSARPTVLVRAVPAPRPAVRERCAQRRQRQPPWPGELAAVAFLLVGYDRVADFARLRTADADRAGASLLHLERWSHLAVERGLVDRVAPHALLGQVLSFYYDFAHGVVTLGVLAALYALRPASYRPARRALIGVNLGALAVYLALPLTPPRLLPGAGIVDVVARSGTLGAWTTGSGVGRHANEYASLPSLHAAWAVWVLLAVWSTGRPLVRAAAGAHLLLTVTVVLVTGNHYVLDVVAGAVLTLGVWAVCRPRHAALSPPPPPASRTPA